MAIRQTELKLSKAVAEFANSMQHSLRDNRHKSGWKKGTCSLTYLLGALKKEVDELEESLRLLDKSPERVMIEAADVANFAMMIHDRHCNNHGNIGT